MSRISTAEPLGNLQGIVEGQISAEHDFEVVTDPRRPFCPGLLVSANRLPIGFEQKAQRDSVLFFHGADSFSNTELGDQSREFSYQPVQLRAERVDGAMAQFYRQSLWSQ